MSSSHPITIFLNNKPSPPLLTTNGGKCYQLGYTLNGKKQNRSRQISHIANTSHSLANRRKAYNAVAQNTQYGARIFPQQTARHFFHQSKPRWKKHGRAKNNRHIQASKPTQAKSMRRNPRNRRVHVPGKHRTRGGVKHAETVRINRARLASSK